MDFNFSPLLNICVILATIYSVTNGQSNPTGYKCPRAEGSYADPKTCRRFYQCSENHPYAQTCPPGLYFDDVKKHCMHKTKDLVCGPVPLPDITSTTQDPLKAEKCDPAACALPECFCSSDGTIIPGDVAVDQVPMMITITFDGALNHQNVGNYQTVINVTDDNPNDCPASFTFFVSHQYSSYYHIQHMASLGHEIGLQGVYGREPEDWWEKAPNEEWKAQIVDQRSMLSKFANVTKRSIFGIRAPFLRNGGNEMVTMMKENGILYDASLPVSTKVPLWPYTYDYKIPHDCIPGKICPTQSFPGVWEYPLNMMFSDDGTGGNCALADQCVFQEDEDLILDFLMENFYRHYDGNRAPLGLYFHSNWFQIKEKVQALKRFIEKVQSSYKDVWFVSIKRALDWVQNPKPTQTAHPAFACDKKRLPSVCQLPKNCMLNFEQNEVEETRYMETCAECPRKYPWVDNPEGRTGYSVGKEDSRDTSDVLDSEEEDFLPDNY